MRGCIWYKARGVSPEIDTRYRLEYCRVVFAIHTMATSTDKAVTISEGGNGVYRESRKGLTNINTRRDLAIFLVVIEILGQDSRVEIASNFIETSFCDDGLKEIMKLHIISDEIGRHGV